MNNSVIYPIKKGTPHYEHNGARHTYRYGYQEFDNENVIACVEERLKRYTEAEIRAIVTAYCLKKGIENEYKREDYGY